MPTTLTNGSTVLTLPDDLRWTDEFAWVPVQESREYSVTGAQLIDRRLKQAGRPITLSGAPDAAWVTRAVTLTLQQWAQQLEPALSLSYRGVTYAVEFDHGQPPLEVTPIVDYASPVSTDQCWFVLRLITR